jgi:hypothetical protein
LKDRIPGSAATEPLRAFAAPPAARPAAPRFAPLIVAGIGGLVLLAVLVFIRLLLAPPAPMALPAAAASAAPWAPTAAPALAEAPARPGPVAVLADALPPFVDDGQVLAYDAPGGATIGPVPGRAVRAIVERWGVEWLRAEIDGAGLVWVRTAALAGNAVDLAVIPCRGTCLSPTAPAPVVQAAPAAPAAPIYVIEPTAEGAQAVILGTAPSLLPPPTPTPCPAPLVGTGCRPLVVAP